MLRGRVAWCCFALGLATAGLAQASDWPGWRGPADNGLAGESGLVSTWSVAGENLVWRQDFIGRSTPVIHRGRLFVTGRGGEGIHRHEKLAAYDARDGKLLWERTLSTQLTNVPYNRAGWASPVVDAETGTVYAQAIAGSLVAYDPDGKLVWQRLLSEELGRASGYGGRTMSPLVDEERLIVSVIGSSWGKLGGPPRHRVFAFDKRTGAILWIGPPGGTPTDLNITANGTVGVIGGQRLYIHGGADGVVYALKARTGEKVWQFAVSQRGLNSTPLIAGDLVVTGHSEENVDVALLGRTVAIDATGAGDVTKTHERWRRDIGMGFPSPVAAGGRAYVMDNAANLYALVLATGATLWQHNLGTVGKSSPVLADGKLYATEVNGKFHLQRPEADRATSLDVEQINVAGGRYAEIYGSPAVAYGRVYFTSEEGLYCLGDKNAPFAVRDGAPPVLLAERRGTDTATLAQVVPAEVTARLGEAVQFELRLFNETGRELRRVQQAEWSLDGLAGAAVDSAGKLVLPAAGPGTAGEVVAKVGALEARARVRGFGALPVAEGFDQISGRGRPYWIGGGRYQVIEREGGKVLEKPVVEAGLQRSDLYLEWPYASNYTIEAEVMGTQSGRRMTDVGVINSGYLLQLLGNGQKLQVEGWPAPERLNRKIPFTWEMDRWYVLRLRVEAPRAAGGAARVLAKVWPKGNAEPADWTIALDDPIPSLFGAPGVTGYSPSPIYYDNVRITPN